jgi:hypothetical protein
MTSRTKREGIAAVPTLRPVPQTASPGPVETHIRGASRSPAPPRSSMGRDGSTVIFDMAPTKYPGSLRFDWMGPPPPNAFSML